MIYGQELKDYIEANPKLIRARESVRYPGLFVIKYQRYVFFNGCWNDILIESRGLVVDKDFNPVIRPFTKIKNRFEDGTNIHRDEPVLSVRKVNGFMAAVTRVPGHGIVVSTTGSLDSEFADLAAKWLPDSVTQHIGNTHTYLFEIVDPSDPHIVPEEPGAYLIGARPVNDDQEYRSNVSIENFLDGMAHQMGVRRPEWLAFDRFSDLTDIMNDCRHEGYVVYSKDTALKIKSPYYLTKKLFARMNADKLAKMLNQPQALRERLEEESYPLIDYLREHQDEFLALDEQARLVFIRDYFEKVTNG